MDSMRLELFKNKDERAQSAIASQEVRKHLAGFIRSKRLGSSTQISTIAGQSTQQKGSSQSPGSSAAPFQPGLNASNQDGYDNCGAGPMACQSSMANESDDHPLRKTASMPTMHIPYKAQSLSRRRQMERRTTMSPLMKRKSRPRRLLLHSLDSQAAEYSSNPCIIAHASGSNFPLSLSQSSSPPPMAAGSSNQNHPLRFDNHKDQNLLADSMMRASSQSNLDKNHSMAMKSIELMGASEEERLKQLQHLRVQEAIRKTVINRASSRSKMAAAGGSLDSEMPSTRYAPDPFMATGLDRASTEVHPPSDQPTSSSSHLLLSAQNRDELRQWSLDGADMRINLNAKLAASNRTLAWGLYHRLRLGTTADAATLRQSQSPSSSISMGLTSGANMQQQQQQKSTNMIEQQRLQALGKNDPALRLNQQLQQQQQLMHASRLYSSSSSSTSSLLSGQDSLDDSSSKAIDLSSSSEAGRRRQQQQQALNSTSAMFDRPPMMVPSNDQLNRLNYQKVLQDSFNQLQLSQENMKRILLPAHSIEVAQLTSQHLQLPSSQQSHPLLGQTNKTAVSLDIPSNNHVLGQGPNANAQQRDKSHLLSSFAEQFNLTKSAQNLISLQQQQQLQLGNLIAQQQRQQHQDLNDWLSAYNNLIQSNDFQRSNQINSSLLAKIAALPEPYQSALVAQLIQQQQQMHLIQSGVGITAADKLHQQHQADSATLVASDQQTSMQLQLADQRSNSISRALSSPILVASNMLKGEPCMDVEMQTNEFGAQGGDRLQTDSVDEEIGLFARSLQQQLSSNHMDSNNQEEARKLDCSFDQTSGGSFRPTTVGMNQFSLDLSLSSASGSAGDKTTSSGISYKHMAHNSIGLSTAENNFASISCSADAQDDYNKQLNNCTNLLYTPIFESTSSTGLIYELELCNHKCICNNENNHPENSYRVLAIWRRLYDSGLMRKCARIAARKASLSELQLCHSETYANYFGRNPYERIKLRQLDLSKLPIEGLTQLECGGQGADIDTAWNEEKTPAVARLAAGCVIEAAIQVAEGKLLNAFAIVRPPGHHAEYQQAMGFCFFNSIAIAARVLLERHQVNRVLIVDWDVHHGNGIQKMFYEDKRVMYISLHRHDKGNFFPGTGNLDELGTGAGEGFNWNIAWSGETMGDAEYLAAFRSVVMPIARDFNPSMVLVACGFDGSLGHPFNFGGYKLSPACFAQMTRQLMALANGRLVLALEGGYQLSSICDCAEACVRALLKGGAAGRMPIDNQTESAPLDQVLECELKRQPNQSARDVLHQISQLATKYWPSIQLWRHTIDISAFDATNERP